MTWGRLTLQSGKPRMGADIVSSTLYYTPFETNANTELSVSLASLAAGLYDVYLNGASLALTPAWTNNATPSVARVKDGGLWKDAAGRLYLGTVYIHATGQCKWQPKPAPANFGPANVLGVFNAYNRLPVHAVCQDTASLNWSNAPEQNSWLHQSSGIRFANNSSNNRIYWVDGIGDAQCTGRYQVSYSAIAAYNGQPAACTVGVGLDTVYPANWWGLLSQGASNHSAVGGLIDGKDTTLGAIGLHYWQALEQSTSVPIMFYGNNFMQLSADLAL